MFSLADRPDPGVEREMIEAFVRIHRLSAPGRSGRAFRGHVRQEDRALRAALDHHLDGMKKGGAWSRLVVKYFGAEALDVLGRAHKP